MNVGMRSFHGFISCFLSNTCMGDAQTIHFGQFLFFFNVIFSPEIDPLSRYIRIG
jgi:hypothetical protein